MAEKEYIEREKTIKKLDHFQAHLHTVEGTTAIGVAKTLIEGIPAADVRPVVRGEWGKRLNPSFSPFDDSGAYLYRCNQCGHIQNYESNFCPNCGTDMREES